MAPIPFWEAKEQNEWHAQDLETYEKLKENLLKSPQWKQLESLLGKQNKKLFDRIVTLYSSPLTAKYTSEKKVQNNTNSENKENSIDTLRLKWAVFIACTNEKEWKSIGYVFDEQKKAKIAKIIWEGATQFDITTEWWEKKTPSHLPKSPDNLQEQPEKQLHGEPLLRRLQEQKYLHKQDVDDFIVQQNKNYHEKNIDRTGESKETKEFIRKHITWAHASEILAKLFPQRTDNTKQETTPSITREEYEASDLHRDFNTLKFDDFNSLISKHYVQIPENTDQTAWWNDKQADFQLALERTFEEIQATNGKDANQILGWKYEEFKLASSNDQRYAILHSIFIQSEIQKALGGTQKKVEKEEKNQREKIVLWTTLPWQLSWKAAEAREHLQELAMLWEPAKQKKLVHAWSVQSLSSWGKLDLAKKTPNTTPSHT